MYTNQYKKNVSDEKIQQKMNCRIKPIIKYTTTKNDSVKEQLIFLTLIGYIK